MGMFAFGQPVRREEGPRLLRRRGDFIADRNVAVQERFTSDKIVATGSTPEEFGERIKSDFEMALKVVKEANIPLSE